MILTSKKVHYNNYRMRFMWDLSQFRNLFQNHHTLALTRLCTHIDNYSMIVHYYHDYIIAAYGLTVVMSLLYKHIKQCWANVAYGGPTLGNYDLFLITKHKEAFNVGFYQAGYITFSVLLLGHHRR